MKKISLVSMLVVALVVSALNVFASGGGGSGGKGASGPQGPSGPSGPSGPMLTTPVAVTNNSTTAFQFVDSTVSTNGIVTLDTTTSTLALHLGADATSNTTLTTPMELIGPTLIAGGTSNQTGGILKLSTGSSKGSGTEPQIQFWSAARGSTGTTLTAPVEQMFIGYNSAIGGIALNLVNLGFTSAGQIGLPSVSNALVYTDGPNNMLQIDASDNWVNVNPSGQFIDSGGIGLTAAANDAQSGCTALTKTFNTFTTVGTLTNSTCLISSTTKGQRCVIVNNGANTLHVFPASGGTINGGSTNAEWLTGVTATTAGSAGHLYCQAEDSSGDWDCW